LIDAGRGTHGRKEIEVVAEGNRMKCFYEFYMFRCYDWRISRPDIALVVGFHALPTSPNTGGRFMSFLNRLVQNPLGAIGVLAVAASLEAWGDSFFQAGFYRTSGVGRVFALVCGTVVLAVYGATVNLPRWDFGKLIGVYVMLFFLAAQILARVRFGQSPTAPVCLGGSLIVIGGAVMAFWKA
jgi:hypothetical protein